MAATSNYPCPNCGHFQPGEAQRCSHCGALLDGEPRPLTVRRLLSAVGIGLMVLPLGVVATCVIFVGLQYLIGFMLISMVLLGLNAIRRLLS